MKTIICGPPHSGKSVFIANLVKLLPSGHYVRVNANGDGEGTWSNNPDQSEVMGVRVKGSNFEKDFLRWKRQIENAKLDIVVVDIGGRLQDDKAPLFEACDSFVVVSNDIQMINEWISFGIKHGCKCIGTILSKQGDLHEEVHNTEPYVSGVMSGLERGHDLGGSSLIKAIANSIIVSSGFNGYSKISEPNVIDIYDLGIKLGMSQHWKTTTGISVHNVWYQPERAQSLYEYVHTFYTEKMAYRIYGARSLWASCLVATTIYNNGAHSFEVYGIISKAYIPISRITTGDKASGRINCIIKENEEYTLLSVALPTYFSPKDMEHIVLPRLDKNKKLLLSGKMPPWLAMAIIISYDNQDKYMHYPGQGYIQVEAIDKTKYGNIISAPTNLY